MQKIKEIIRRLRKMELTGYEKLQLAACTTERGSSAAEALLAANYAEAISEISYLGIEAYGTLYGAYLRTKDSDN